MLADRGADVFLPMVEETRRVCRLGRCSLVTSSSPAFPSYFFVVAGTFPLAYAREVGWIGLVRAGDEVLEIRDAVVRAIRKIKEYSPLVRVGQSVRLEGLPDLVGVVTAVNRLAKNREVTVWLEEMLGGPREVRVSVDRIAA